MQIILLEKLVNVGELGQVVKVRAGYARNFLIPQGKARRATPENLKMIEEKRAELENAASQKLAQSHEQAAALEGKTIRISQKAGVDGRLFGSVGTVDIAEALKAGGHTVEKAMVRMPSGPLKQVGEYPLVVALHSDVVANIVVNVVGETIVQ